MTTIAKVHFVTRNRRKCLTSNQKPKQPFPQARVPRISTLMALAIRFDQLLRKGTVRDMSELARLTHVTQPRMTQIMNLLHLAPDLQEELLHLPPSASGDDWITERDVRLITRKRDWREQRDMWKLQRDRRVWNSRTAPCSTTTDDPSSGM